MTLAATATSATATREPMVLLLLLLQLLLLPGTTTAAGRSAGPEREREVCKACFAICAPFAFRSVLVYTLGSRALSQG